MPMMPLTDEQLAVIKAVSRTCCGQVGDEESRECGFDFNALIVELFNVGLAEPGVARTDACPRCGTRITWTPPLFD